MAVLRDFIKAIVKLEVTLAVTYNGWSNDEMALEYFKYFYKYTQPIEVFRLTSWRGIFRRRGFSARDLPPLIFFILPFINESTNQLNSTLTPLSSSIISSTASFFFLIDNLILSFNLSFSLLFIKGDRAFFSLLLLIFRLGFRDYLLDIFFYTTYSLSCSLFIYNR